MLNPTPDDRLTDDGARPYFLWDLDMTLARFRQCLVDEDPAVSGYFHAKLVRQARPDDVFRFTTAGRIRSLWDHIAPHLGESRDFWSWIFDEWERDGREWR